jgi:hypothetical protein
MLFAVVLYALNSVLFAFAHQYLRTSYRAVSKVESISLSPTSVIYYPFPIPTLEPIALMADNQGTQEGEERSYVFREVALPFDPPDHPPGTQVQVKVYKDQNRIFTYLNTELMTSQQRDMAAPTIFTVIPSRPDKKNAFTLQQVPQNIMMSNGINYALREVEPCHLGYFTTQTSGCNVAYVEDRSALPYLGPVQRLRATEIDGRTLVRKDAVLLTGAAAPPNQQASSKLQSTQCKQPDPPTAGPSSRP